MKISFHGGVRGVTGSNYLIETSKGRLLIDCGLFQGERMCGGKNYEELDYDPAHVDAILVSHAHLDHTGRLPLMMNRGFRGKIYATPPTVSLARLVLEDAQRVMKDNAERCGDPELYSVDDVINASNHMHGVNYHTEFEPIPRVKVMFHDVGHILGSAYITVKVPGSETKDGNPMTLVFSGDVGNDFVPILPDTEPIHEADVLFMETTYGNRSHEAPSERKDKLTAFTTKILSQNGTVIIPSFSIERTQELLYELDELIEERLIPDVPVYLDSPLAIKSTGVYRDFKDYLRFDRDIRYSPDGDFFSFPRLKETLTVDESKRINDDSNPKIIIAGSGMMTGGRVLHHLKRYLPDSKSGVLIIGYQAEGTLGRQIQNHVPEVTIYDAPVPVKASIEKIESFSAHADKEKLLRWMVPEEGDLREVYLIHGDPEAKEAFKKLAEEKVDAKVIIPTFQQVLEY